MFQTYCLNTEMSWAKTHSEPLAGGQIYFLLRPMNSFDGGPYANLLFRLNCIVCRALMVFGGTGLIRCRLRRWEMVDRMSGGVNRIGDFDVSDGRAFETGLNGKRINVMLLWNLTEFSKVSYQVKARVS